MTPEAQARKDRAGAGGARLEHRHYVTIAAIIRALPAHAKLTRNEIAELFACALVVTNDRFDPARFVLACK